MGYRVGWIRVGRTRVGLMESRGDVDRACWSQLALTDSFSPRLFGLGRRRAYLESDVLRGASPPRYAMELGLSWAWSFVK
jgi:hypothetical protein